MAWRGVVQNSATRLKNAPSSSREAFEAARDKLSQQLHGGRKSWGWFGWRGGKSLRESKLGAGEGDGRNANNSGGNNTGAVGSPLKDGERRVSQKVREEGGLTVVEELTEIGTARGIETVTRVIVKGGSL